MPFNESIEAGEKRKDEKNYLVGDTDISPDKERLLLSS